MAKFVAKEVRDEKGVSLGWLVYDGDTARPGPYMTPEAAMAEAQELNDQLEEGIKKKAVTPPERSRSSGMGGR